MLGKGSFKRSGRARQSSTKASSSGDRDTVVIPSRESATLDGLTYGSLSKVRILTPRATSFQESDGCMCLNDQIIDSIDVMNGSETIGMDAVSETNPVFAKRYRLLIHKSMNRVEVALEFDRDDLIVPAQPKDASTVAGNSNAKYRPSIFERSMIKALGDVQPAFSGLSEHALQLIDTSNSASTLDTKDRTTEKSIVTVLHRGVVDAHSAANIPRTILWFNPEEG